MAKKGQSSSRHQKPLTFRDEAFEEAPSGVEILSTEHYVKICYPDEPKIQHDVSHILRMEGLAKQFTVAIARVLNDVSAGKSRRTKYKNFKFGYLKFLETSNAFPTSISDFNEQHVRDFIVWLTNAKSERTGEILSIGNRIHKLGCFADALRKISRHHPEVDVGQLVPWNPWPGETAKRNTTRPLDDKTLRKLLVHIESELEDCVKFVESRIKTEADVTATTRSGKKTADGSSSNLDPSSQEMFLAFEYLLIFTAFNEQSLRDMSLEDIEIEELYGLARISFRSEKSRAGSAVRRVFVENPNDVLSVHRVVKAMIKWTANLRKNAEPAMRDKLFLFHPRTERSGRSVGSFSRVDKKSDSIIQARAAALSKKIGEKYIGSRAIRAAGAQILHEFTNGDLPLIALGLGHSSTTTTNNNYRSRSVMDNEESKLGGVMLQRERYLESDGKVDPRNKRGQGEATAATPGWTCLDNMSSPIEGQRQGFPCTAYPMCPTCPHGQPHPDAAYSLARTIQLYAKVEEAVSVQGISAVKARYGDLIPFLAANSARVDDREVVARASLIKLSPLPDLD